jgi:molecular chaperone DnaK
MKIVESVLKDAKFQPSDIEAVVLVGGQTRMPKIQEDIKNLFNREPNREINPDEVVAIGAAIEAGILQGDVKDVLLLDVTPLSLGIETFGKVNTILLSKNTTIPTSKTQTFSTAADNQPSVEIHVLQGERPMAQDNKTLGRFILDGIPPAPKGTPQIEVTFDIDANGILNVSAKDKATGKSQSIRIESAGNISKEEIEKMKRDAEAHAEEDKKKQELIELKNSAENALYLFEKTIADLGDKIEESLKKEAEEKAEELKKVKDGDNMEEIKAKTSELSSALQKIGTQAYKEQETPENNQEEKEKEDVEEGEYKEEDKS